MSDSRKRRFVSGADESSSKKKYESGSLSGHRFLIPAKAAGAMIGKGGEVIKRLRSEHNCRIIVPDSQGPERLVIIDANPNIIIDIWNDILPSLKEYMNAKESDYKGISSKSLDPENEIDLRLVVHESQAGAVIGKGGERIRNLIDKHGMTMIKLYQTFCPNSTDRVVRMVASIENLLSCVENVFDLLENQTIKGVRKDYNPDDYDEAIASTYGGYISKDSRTSSRRNNNVNKQLRRTISENNFDSNGYMARPSVFSRVATNYENELNAVRSALNQRNPGLGREVTELFDGVIRMSAVNDINTRHVSRVAVPPNLVTPITGKDGKRLREMERDSGAEIEVDIDRMSSRETVFIIRGSADQIFRAQCVMQLCARKFSDIDGF